VLFPTYEFGIVINYSSNFMFKHMQLCACESVTGTESILTVNHKRFLSSCHASKTVRHNGTTLVSALTQAVAFRSCTGGEAFRI
jgi:hypothetical protein